MKTGGRKKGTPNKENPIKGFIKTHSLAYFEPKEIVGDDGKKRTMSDFDCDMMMLAPAYAQSKTSCASFVARKKMMTTTRTIKPVSISSTFRPTHFVYS